MERRSIDRVRIRMSKHMIEISWEARNEIIERLMRVGSSGGTLVDSFQRHGTSSPVLLSGHEHDVLLDVVRHWMNEVGRDKLPAWVPELRDALLDERPE